LVIVVAVPLAGYVFLALDVRAYLRSLQRGVAVIVRYLPFTEVPDWARTHTPRAVAALGLRMPCSEADLLQAYRRRVKRLHPDHGGEERRFLRLQADFEEALLLVRASAAACESRWPKTPRAA
jgi:hypothetical protein